jgi:precorrin-3B C17-methyltransferase
MKQGKILLVGFGPGSTEQMTYRARAAIEEADVVIGYTTYIKLVKELLEGKEVIRKGMTEEIDRCIEAYEHALKGKVVALISSGDIGIYGMAGPTYEVLFKAGWTPSEGIEVEVIPGTTALNACASLVGAPLTHDFCSISLSDLLTPWPTIARRIDAVAKSDFVVALYNPKSGRRTQQIVEAQRIMLLHRDENTPVAIVKSGYRRRQDIQMTTLSEMADCEIGMLCTVLIGNSSTVMREGLMITPRGYANKYDNLTGEAKSGEQAGRSLTMGLVSWYACVRSYMDENPTLNLHKVAAYFDMPLVDILQAVMETPADEVSEKQAWQVDPSQIKSVLKTSFEWGKLRAVVRNDGVIAELLLDGHSLSTKGDWLNITNEYFHLHINQQCLANAWFYSQKDKQYGLYFTDTFGALVFSLLLVKTEGDYDETAFSQFKQAIQDASLSIGHNDE